MLSSSRASARVAAALLVDRLVHREVCGEVLLLLDAPEEVGRLGVLGQQRHERRVLGLEVGSEHLVLSVAREHLRASRATSGAT